jgi:hypothetical protein
MAARLKTIKYTIPVSGEASLSTILNSPLDEFISSVTFRAAAANAAALTWRAASGGSDGGYLEAREAASFDLSGKFVKAENIYIAGTAGDIVYITVIS